MVKRATTIWACVKSGCHFNSESFANLCTKKLSYAPKYANIINDFSQHFIFTWVIIKTNGNRDGFLNRCCQVCKESIKSWFFVQVYPSRSQLRTASSHNLYKNGARPSASAKSSNTNCQSSIAWHCVLTGVGNSYYNSPP